AIQPARLRLGGPRTWQGGERVVLLVRAATRADRQPRRLAQRLRQPYPWGRLQTRAQQAGHDRLAGLRRRLEDALRDRGGGRLGDQDDHLGGGVVAQQRQRLEGCDAADLLLEVAAPGAERVAHPGPGAVNQDADLLHPAPGGADQADPARADDVGEAEADAVDDRGPAVGPHHQQATRAAPPLERDLVLERDVVAEEDDVQALQQRLARLGRGVGA